MAAAPQLGEAFDRGLSPGLAGRFGEGAALEATLQALVEAGRAAWPAVNVEPAELIRHVASRLAADSDLARLHAADLYLAYGCLAQDAAALEAIDRLAATNVPAVLGQLPPGLAADEVLQRLRVKLLVWNKETAPAITTYSGKGPLVPFMRAAAVRLVQDHLRRGAGQREVAASDDALLETPAAAGDLDTQLLKARFAPEFKAAFQEALTTLSPRDLNILRMTYLDGVSPEEIGRVYQTHRTTVWRWLNTCREELLSQTRKKLAERVKVNDGELSSLMNAVQSQLDVSINRMLKK
ncbi:MAG: sigma-70 family RNA polymerase sigma factor [Myxococcaceae bacterium]|nr:sigma-70 family RNA polymerase sigma factor [Myxococcaceae bacterium]